MRIRVDERFVAEAQALGFVHRCPDCVYFFPASAGPTCAHEWPNEVHLRVLPSDGGELDFCKEFETA